MQSLPLDMSHLWQGIRIAFPDAIKLWQALKLTPDAPLVLLKPEVYEFSLPRKQTLARADETPIKLNTKKKKKKKDRQFV